MEYITQQVKERAEEIKKYLVNGEISVGVKITDRDFWDNMYKHIDVKDLISRAEKYISEPFPEITEEIYLEHKYKKDNFVSDKLMFKSMRMIEQTVLAECVENKGRFVPYINEWIKSVCNRKSWVRAGHDSVFGYSDYYGVHGQIDLYSSSAAWRLSVCDCCMGDKLERDVREKLKNKTREKVIDVFFKRLHEDPDKIKINGIVPLYWLDAFDNWLSVCLGGVVCAGLYYCGNDEKALLIAVYEKLIKNYLNSLPEGYCVEGLSYWGYGFGKFIAAADTIYRASDGKIDLYSQKGFFETAQLGLRIGITNSVYPTVGDCDINTKPEAFCMEYLYKRTGMEYECQYEDVGNDIYIVMMMSNWDVRLSNTLKINTAADNLRTYFKKQGILISRTADRSLGAYIQAGTNHNPHNHNDIGGFIIAAGDECFVSDPGTSKYIPNLTFSKNRYTLEVLSSLGHSVPRVGNKLQGPAEFESVNTNSDGKRSDGAYDEVRFKGMVTETEFCGDKDRIVIDLKEAYDCENLNKLDREMIFDRRNEEITITDSFEFKNEDIFETAFITFMPVEITDSENVIICGKNADMHVKYGGNDGVIGVLCVKDAFAEDHSVAVHPMRISKKVKAKNGSVSMKLKICAVKWPIFPLT